MIYISNGHHLTSYVSIPPFQQGITKQQSIGNLAGKEWQLMSAACARPTQPPHSTSLPNMQRTGDLWMGLHQARSPPMQRCVSIQSADLGDAATLSRFNVAPFGGVPELVDLSSRQSTHADTAQVGLPPARHPGKNNTNVGGARSALQRDPRTGVNSAPLRRDGIRTVLLSSPPRPLKLRYDRFRVRVESEEGENISETGSSMLPSNQIACTSAAEAYMQ